VRLTSQRKVIFLLLFFSLFWNLSCEKKQSEIERVKVFIEKYNRYSNPISFQEEKSSLFSSNDKKLKKMLAAECKIIFQENDTQTVMNANQFLAGLKKCTFYTSVEAIMLNHINIEKLENGYRACITKGFTDYKEYEVAECWLIIQKVAEQFLIQEIKCVYREPSIDEVKRIKKIITAAIYNPKKGLGAKYLGWPGGLFNVSFDLSAESNKIVFPSLKHNSSELYLINLDGSNMQRLTDTPYWEINPVFSPDGKGVLFFSDEELYSGYPYYINLNSRSIKSIDSEFERVTEACYSQDGRLLGIIGDRGNGMQVYIYDISEQKIWPVTTNKYAKHSIIFSTDNQLVCFSQKYYDNTERSVEIFCSRIDGAELTQITTNRRQKWPFAVTRDHKILFVQDNEENRRELYIVDILAKMPQYILGGKTNGMHTLRLSCDEQQVFFVDDIAGRFEYDIYSLDLKKKTLKRATYENAYIFDFALSSEGKYLIYMKDKKGAPRRGRCELYVTTIAVWNPKLITKNY